MMLGLLILRIKKIKDDLLLFVIMTSMAFILTAIFGASMISDYIPSVVIADMSDTIQSKEMIEEIKEVDNYTFEVVDYQRAIEKVKETNTTGAIIIEENFQNNGVKLLTINESIEAMQLENTLNNKLLLIRNKNNLTQVAIEVLNPTDDWEISQIISENVKNNFDIYWEYKRPYTTKMNIIDKLNVDQFNNLIHYMIGFTLFFSTYVLVFGIADILKEKQDYTLQRQLISPLGKGAIIGANTLVTIMMGFIQVIILVVLGKFLLNIQWGEHIFAILAIFGGFIFCITAFGMFLSGLIKTHEQLSSITPVILTSAAMLGGCMWPLEIINSKLLLFIANVMPHKWALQALEGIVMYDLPVNSIVFPILVLISMGLIFYLLGVKLIKI